MSVKPELKVGMLVRDNDPRLEGRTRYVERIEGDRAVLSLLMGHGWFRPTKVRLDRIHLDGKPRRSGWSVVAPTTRREVGAVGEGVRT